MTSTTTNIARSGDLFDKIANAFHTTVAVMANASVGMACSREAERLARLSDEDLAKLGLTRDRIIQHAFARYMI
jgi:hypothetical protein